MKFSTSPCFCELDRTLLKVSGDDRLRVINNFFTNQVQGLKPGQGVEGFFPTPKGKINGHGCVLFDETALWIEGAPGQSESIPAQINQFVITEEVEFENACERLSAILFVPPIEKEPPPPVQTPSWEKGADSNNGPIFELKFSSTFLPGADIYFFQENQKSAAIDHWTQNQAVQLDRAELDDLRIRMGCPLFGRDFSADNLPQELNRDERAISFTKGCYLGQETIARIDSLGHVNRHVVPVQVNSDSSINLPLELKAEGKKIGELSSLAGTTDSGGNRAGIATLRVPFHQSGTKIPLDNGTLSVN